MKKTVFDTSIITVPLHILSSGILKILGWRREGRLPDFGKFILIGAPHTSNWDFPLVLAYAFSYRIKVFWLGKEALFRNRVLGRLFQWFGGIPVDRAKSQDAVSRTVEIFNAVEKLVLVISPEGTRKKVKKWRTGFYHIARGARIPVVLGFLDYRRKAGGLGPVLFPSGNFAADMETIRAFYATVTGKRPELASPADVPA
ncbi:MAG TPA: lysophospholipid acyltransferase family protein [Syntrophales bacterium]|nr:lysophospholipid acyltransferase family protein [Syntrophales bacterium]